MEGTQAEKAAWVRVANAHVRLSEARTVERQLEIARASRSEMVDAERMTFKRRQAFRKAEAAWKAEVSA